MSPTTIRNLIISSVLLLVSLGVFVFAVKEISDKEKVLQSQVTALAEEQKQESAFFKLQKVSEDSTSDREKLSSYFLKQGSDSIDFLNKVETLAPAAGVTLVTKSLEEKSDKKAKQQWIEVSFSFSGTRENVEQFIDILEHLPYLSQITNVSLTARTSDNWEAVVAMKVFIISYDK